MPRGRKPNSETTERKEKQKGYITIIPTLRVRVEPDALTLEEFTGTNAETKEPIYGNYHYFTSWQGLFNYLVRRFTTEKVSKKNIMSFVEAKNEILTAINELRVLLLGEIDKQIKTSNLEIKKYINKYNV